MKTEEEVQESVFLIKYGLNGKIPRCKVHRMNLNGYDGKYIWLKLSSNSYPVMFKRGDVAFTEQEALSRLEEMRKAKIASLEKSIKKLQGVSFKFEQ